MSRAYNWSLAASSQRTGYNLVLMGISVVVAFVIGGLGLVGILANYLRADLLPSHGLSDLDIDSFGFAIAGGLIVVAVVCFALYRVGARRRARN